MPPRRKPVISPGKRDVDSDSTIRDLRSCAALLTSDSPASESMATPSQTDPQRQTSLTVWDWELPTSTASADKTHAFHDFEPGIVQRHTSTPLQHTSATEFSLPLSVTYPDQSRQAPILPLQSGPTLGTKRKSISDHTADESSGPKRTSLIVANAFESRSVLTPIEASPAPDDARLVRSEPSSISIGVTNATPGAIPDSNLDESLISPRTTKRGSSDPTAVPTLPARKVFSIQVGERLFQLSGQTIASDGPSYFTNFFEEQIRKSQRNEGIGTLYIDRDPETFKDIVLHLQGYHVEPRDGPHFVRLFADAQYFSLPRLTAQLFSSAIYIRIGDTDFHIPRDIFNRPGDSPNFFSLDISVFFTTPSDRSSGSNRRALLRPPAILPPSVPNRSAKTFADLLHILKGYDVEIRNEEHRSELLRDARYFHLKGLEQRLIHHDITYNLARQRSEIRIRLEDIRQSGISFVPDSTSSQASAAASPATSSSGSSTVSSAPGWVFYQRPYADTESHALIIEISTTESATMSIAPASPNAQARIGRVTFYGSTLARISSLLSVVATRLNLPSIQPLGTAAGAKGNTAVSLPSSPVIHNASTVAAPADERVKARIGPDADVSINGRKWVINPAAADEDESGGGMDVDTPSTTTARPHMGRKASEVGENGLELVLRRAQWRIRIQPVSGAQNGSRTAGAMEAILGAVKLDAFTNERARNAALAFLQ